jgi:hypothetical protein
VGIGCADHVIPYIRKKLALTSPTTGGRSVGIVRSQTKATEFLFVCRIDEVEVNGIRSQSQRAVLNAPSPETKY